MFTSSKQFSSSFYFTKSSEFTKTEYFTCTIQFSDTNEFSESKDFSKSIDFSPSATLKDKNSVIIDIKMEDSKKGSIGMKIGIGVSIGAAALLAIIIAAIILLRRRKSSFVEDINEEIDLIDSISTNSVITQNPLMGVMVDDDPFEAEFE